MTRPGRTIDTGTDRSRSATNPSNSTPGAAGRGAGARGTLKKPAEASKQPPETRASVVARQYGRRDYYLRRLLAFGDCTALTLALLFAVSVDRRPAWTGDLLIGLAFLPIWLVLFTLYGLYERDTKRISHSSVDDVPVVFHAVVIGSLLLWLYYRITAGGSDLFSTMAPFALAALTLVITGRTTTRSICSRRLAPERVLLIGSNPSLLSLADKMGPGGGLRLTLVGLLLGRDTPVLPEGPPVLGRIATVDLREILLSQRIGRIVMADADVAEERALEVLRQCKELQVKVSLLPAMFSALGQATEIDDVLGITLLGINPPVLSRSSRILKRFLDLVGSLVLLVLLGPVLLASAIAIRLDSRGPVLFRQERVGRGSRHFRVLKFRTMVADAEAQHAALLAQSADPGWLLLDA